MAVAPDGHSVITSLGMQQSAIWIHDSDGDRAISTAGNALFPKFSADGKSCLLFAAAQRPRWRNELWGVDLRTGRSDRMVSGFAITGYDIADERSRSSGGREASTRKVADLAGVAGPPIFACSHHFRRRRCAVFCGQRPESFFANPTEKLTICFV